MPELEHAIAGFKSPPLTMDSVVHLNLPNKDTYDLREEVPVVGHLIHFLPFWEEVIQANHWVLEVICHGYSIKLFKTTHRNTGDQECPTSTRWTTCMVQRGGKFITWNKCRPMVLPLATSMGVGKGNQPASCQLLP